MENLQQKKSMNVVADSDGHLFCQGAGCLGRFEAVSVYKWTAVEFMSHVCVLSTYPIKYMSVREDKGGNDIIVYISSKNFTF